MHAGPNDTEFLAAVRDGLGTDAEERLEFDQLADRDGAAVLADLGPQNLRRDKKGAAEAEGGFFLIDIPADIEHHMAEFVGDRQALAFARVGRVDDDDRHGSARALTDLAGQSRHRSR